MAIPYCGAVVKQWETEVMFLSYPEEPHLLPSFSTCVSECKAWPQVQNSCKDCTSQRQMGRSMPDQSKSSTSFFFWLHV